MASKNCLYYSPFKWNPWSVNIMSLWHLISIWVSPPPLIFAHFQFSDQTFLKQKKNYWRYGSHMVFKNCLYHSFFKRNLWSINIISLQDFISISVSPPPLIFVHFHVSDQTIFQQKKKSIGDMVHIWVLKTAYTILLSNETLD